MAAPCSARVSSWFERVARARLLLARCVRFLKVPRCRCDDAGVLWWRRLPPGRPNGSPRLPSDSGEGQPCSRARERVGETQQQHRLRPRERQVVLLQGAPTGKRRRINKLLCNRIRTLREPKDIEAAIRSCSRKVRTAVSTTGERVSHPTVLHLAPKTRGASPVPAFGEYRNVSSGAWARVPPLCMCLGGVGRGNARLMRCTVTEAASGRRTAVPVYSHGSFFSRADLRIAEAMYNSRPSFPFCPAMFATACVTRLAAGS